MDNKSVRFINVQGGYEEHQLFKGLNLDLPKGAFIALTGPNGSGKSTLLKFLYKQLKPQSGTIIVEGNDIVRMSQKELARLLGFVAQNGRIDYAFTVREAVAMGRYAYDGKDSGQSIEEAMMQCNIFHLQEKLVTELSGGELQRVLLARALCQQGKLLLLDEPVNHLDVKHQLAIMELLTSLVAKGYTIVCVLHDLLLAQIYSDVALVLHNGSVIAYGKTDQVFSQELLKSVYGIDAHQIYDPKLGKNLWMPSYRGMI